MGTVRLFFRLVLCALCSLALCVLCSLSLSFPSFAAEKLSRLPSGSYRLFDDADVMNGVLHRGIDVSHWQGEIDWKQVASDDVDFVMLGTRYRGEVDPMFRQNATGAADAGIRIGAYLYSYATSKEMAEQEADFVLKLVRDYPISYPIAFDAENIESLGSLPKAEITDIVRAFCNKIRAAGYEPILYANDYWIANILDMDALSQYPVWVAAYERKPLCKNPVMWQGTDSGRIQGIQGNADINLQFSDLSDRIPPDSWKQLDGKWYYYRNYRMQKNALIFDGAHSYYMEDDGTIYTGGWKTMDGVRRYFSPATGVMALGWLSIDGSWYYFSPEGSPQTGWISHQGAWYHANAEGVMQTGRIEVDGVSYFLGADGAMYHDTVIEWNGKRWSIDGSGAMSEYQEPTEAAELSGQPGESVSLTEDSGASYVKPSA